MVNLSLALGFPPAALPALMSSVDPSPQSLLAEFARFSRQVDPVDEVAHRIVVDLVARAMGPGQVAPPSAPPPPPPAPLPPASPAAPPAPPPAPMSPSGFLGLFPQPLREAAKEFLSMARAFEHSLPEACNDLLASLARGFHSTERAISFTYEAAELIANELSPSVALAVVRDRLNRPLRGVQTTEASRRFLAASSLFDMADAIPDPAPPPPTAVQAEIAIAGPPPSAPPLPSPAPLPLGAASSQAPAPAPPPPPAAVPAAAPGVTEAQHLRERVANLPPPSWYGLPSGRTRCPDSFHPRPWSDVLAATLNAAPLASAAPASCPITVDRLASRLDDDSSYDVRRGLFITDLGRAFAWHALRSASDPSDEVLSVALEAVHKCRSQLLQNTRDATFTKAERIGGDKGLTGFVELVDQTVLSACVTDTRRLWDAPQSVWSSDNLSAADVLTKLRNLGDRCDKDDLEVIYKWSCTLEDTCSSRRYVPLMILKNSFSDLKQFASVSDLLAALRRDDFGRMPLAEMANHQPPSAPPVQASQTSFQQRRPRHYSSEAAATSSTSAPELVDALAAAINQLNVHTSARPASEGADVAFTSGAEFPPKKKRIVMGFANFQNWKGRIEFLPADSDVPMFDDAAPDGKFTTNCPFCGVGSKTHNPPVRAYRNISEYEREHKCKPFLPGSKRRLGRDERIAHFSPRCSELWFSMHRHVAPLPEAEQDRLLEPLSDDAFYALIPQRCRPQPRA